MKRLFLVVAIAAILIANVFASQNDPRRPISLDNLGPVKTNTQNERFMPTYNFAIEPVSIVDNYYDYFPGSYSGKAVQRISTPTLDGNWLVFQTQTTPNSSRRIYKTFIDNTGTIQTNAAFGADDLHEGFPGVAVTEGGRPLLAYHVNMDSDPTLEIAFGYDAVIGGVALGMNSSLSTLIDNPHDLEVNGQIVSSNEFIWPSVQIGPSPVAGAQRVYVLGKNFEKNGVEISENVIIYFKDFTEDEIENQTFDNTGWSFTSIPEMNEWNNSTGEWRRPFMTFVVHEDKLYYIGYHLAYTEPDGGEPLDEGTTTVFVGDNYGEGEWTRYSIYSDFGVENPQRIDPYTGETLPGGGIFENQNGFPYESLYMGISQSGHFGVGVDNEGRIHMPAFYSIQTNEGTYYPAFHTVKNIAFDTQTLEWELSEVFPQLDNGTSIPNPPTNITNYDGANDGLNIPDNPLWLNWDSTGDGLYDQVYDDGTWDGIDDGIAADHPNWGEPVTVVKWPYMYWDSDAAEGSMMFHLHTSDVTDGNEEGMMAMIWQDTEKSRDYNLNPDFYPEYADYQNMCELVISVSSDNGRHWSEPIFLNGVDTPEMQGHIPSFPYLGNKVDFIGVDENGDKIGRVYIMYLDDNTYGSSVQNIGQATGGSMEFMALDIVFAGAPVDNTNNDVVPSISMLSQNYPNPFNPETRINFNVVKSGNVELSIYNVKGQLVKTLVNANKTVGSHNVVWQGDDNNGRKVSSGVYFYRVTNGGKSEMKKMVLMK